MRRSRSLLLFSVTFLLALVMSWGTQAFSQDAPDVAMGINPQATYHGGDFDFVDMATGRLNLHIPLVEDHSQRGKLNFTYSVSYSSTGTWAGIQSGNRFYIKPPKYGVSGPAWGNDSWLSGPVNTCYNEPDINYSACAYSLFEGGWGVGQVHPLGTTGSGLESIDGSGILAQGFYLATNKDGVQFNNSNPASIQDANGNGITFGTSTMTDTVGRTWTTTYNSTDVSGCPTGGPVAPSSSTIWTIPGPASFNNGWRTFKLCYSTYNIQTNFNYMGYFEYNSSPNLLTGVVLPDGTTWRFDYDNYSYGDLIAVYLPTGGHISYTWTTLTDSCRVDGVYGVALRTVASRTVFDGTSSQTWTYIPGPCGSSNLTYKVTDPLGNDMVYAGDG